MQRTGCINNKQNPSTTSTRTVDFNIDDYIKQPSAAPNRNMYKAPRTTVITGTGLKIMRTSILANWLRRARVDIEVLKELSTGHKIEDLLSSFYAQNFKTPRKVSRHENLMAAIEAPEREPKNLHVSPEIMAHFISYRNPTKDCFVIIDFRDEQDFNNLHIYGSFNVSNKMLKQGIDAISYELVELMEREDVLIVTVSDSTSLIVDNTLSLRSKVQKFEKATFVVLNQTVTYFASQYPQLIIKGVN